MSAGTNEIQHTGTSVKDLLSKINHPLLDVRVRSLNSVVFKLRNGLVAAGDLVKEREFLIHLLEWFNFDEWTYESQVLSLIVELAKYNEAAQTFAEVGGVEFLSQLRMHSDPSLHPLIDESLEYMLRLQTLSDIPMTTTPSIQTPSHSSQETQCSIMAELRSSAESTELQGDGSINSLHQSTKTTSSNSLNNSPLTATPLISHTTSSLSSKSTFESTLFDAGSYPEVSRQSFGLQGSSVISGHLLRQDFQSLSRASLPAVLVQNSSNEIDPSHYPLSGSDSTGGRSSWTNLTLVNDIQPPFVPVSNDGVGIPYSASTVIPRGAEIETEGIPSNCKEGTFPWIRLTVNDRNILITTQSRLQSSTGDSLLRSCSFLTDVLFRDFPAELFLQRPGLIKSLIQLRDSRDRSSSEILPVLYCLSSYVSRLQQRLSVVMDPSQTLTGSTSRPVEDRVGAIDSTGTSHQHEQPEFSRIPLSDHLSPPNSSEDFESLTPEMVSQLKQEQLSVTQFCLSIISCISPLIICFFNKDPSFLQPQSSLESSSASIQHQVEGGSSLFSKRSTVKTNVTSKMEKRDYCSEVVSLSVALCLKMLSSAVSVLTTVCSGCTEHWAVSCEVEVDSVCSVISQCLSKWRNLAGRATGPEAVSFCPQLQLVSMATMHLASYLCEILGLNKKSTLLPLPSVVSGLMMNGVLGLVHPTLQVQLQPLFETVDAPNYRLFLLVKIMATSFKNMKTFLTSSSLSEDSLQTNKTSLISAVKCAKNGLKGLWFTLNEEFIHKAFQLCLSILSDYKAGSTVYSSGKGLLLEILQHGSEVAREIAFKLFKDYCIKWAVNLRETADRADADNGCDQEEMFIMDSDLLREVCCYGLLSGREEIASASRQIVCSLLSLHTMDNLWPPLSQNILQWFPFVEASLSVSEFLYKQFKELFESKDGPLDDTIRLQVFTRLLFSEKIEIRVWALRNISTYLLSGDTQDQPTSGWFSFPSQSSFPVHDLLTCGTHPLIVGLLSRQQNSFKHEDVLKLVNILKSSTMESSLKKSALEQMVLMLQDPRLHQQVLDDDIVEEMISIILSPNKECNGPDKAIALEELEASLSFVKPCLKCLLLLALSSADLRYRIGNDCNTLLAVLKAALHFHQDKEFLCSVSKLLTLGLFGSLVSVSDDGMVKLPKHIVERLRFPFHVESCSLEYGHFTLSPLDPKLFSSEPLLSMLRLYYHSTMVGGPDDIIRLYERQQLPCADVKLSIPPTDILSMKSLSVTLSLKEYFHQLKSATSHDRVKTILHHTAVVLTTCTLYGDVKQFQSVINDENIGWKKAIERYLTIYPHSTEDISLLTSVISFLQSLMTLRMSATHKPARDDYLMVKKSLVWLVELTCDSKAVCLQLLQSSLDLAGDGQHSSPHRTLLKALLQFFGSLIWRCTSSEYQTSDVTTPSLKIDLLSGLTEDVFRCLDMAGSPDYYDLPLLECSLECLLHLSTKFDLMFGVSSQLPHKLLVEMMTSLRQVLWSFISGRGLKASFMGRGVTSQAALCLSHIVQVLNCDKQAEGCLLQWVRSSPDLGFSWLHHMLDDHDPRVQYASFSLLASMCKKAALVDVIIADWVSCPFGLWGVCFETAVDESNCSIVRQQALYVLVSVSAVCNKKNKWDHYFTCNSDGVSLYGEKALEQFICTYKLFSIVHSVVQLDDLPQLHKRVISSLQILNHQASRSQTPVCTCANNQQAYSEEDKEGLDLKLSKSCSIEEHDSSLGSGISQPSANPMVLSTREGKVLRYVSELVRSLIVCCDPLFMSGMCRLIFNFILAFPELISRQVHEDGIIGALIRLIDIHFLKLFVSAVGEGLVRFPLLSMWVKMNRDIVELMKGVLCSKPELVISHFLRSDLLNSLCEILSVVRSSEICREDKYCLQLCSNVLDLLFMIAEIGQSSSWNPDPVFIGIQTHWSSFIELLLYSLEATDNSPLHSSLRGNTLRILSSLLGYLSQSSISVDEECKERSGTVTVEGTEGILSQLVDTETAKGVGCSHGMTLCKHIIKAYDLSITDSPVRRSLGETLGILLASSVTAKKAALESGLLESLVDQLKTLSSKVKGDLALQSSKKKKECPLVQECVSIMNLLRNFMYRSLEVKSSAVTDTQLLLTVHKLWHWCSTNRKVLLPTLRMLAVLVSQYPGGQTGIATGIPKRTHSPPSLLHSILKLCSATLSSQTSSKLSRSDMSLLSGLFTLLANCALSQECRAVIKKVGFLSLFNTLRPTTKRGTTTAGALQTGSPSNLRCSPSTKLSSLWVRFLVCLSFSNEGQQMVVKQSGSLDILSDIYWSGKGEEQAQQTLLVLRNICFYGPCKTLLASNELFISVVTDALESGNKALVMLASSAIWALLHNSVKIRKSLKESEVANSIDTLHSSLQLSRATGKHLHIDESTNSLEDTRYFKIISNAYRMLHYT